MHKQANIKIFKNTVITDLSKVKLADNVIIDDFVLIHIKKELIIGSYVHIASFSSVVGSETIIFEDFSGCSHGCRIFSSSDDFKDWGFGNPTVPIKYRNVKSSPVILKKFSIIGANSVILPGVTIGEGAAVGANSVVTKDLDPWGIYINNKKIGCRNKKCVLKNYNAFRTKK